ncbi:PilZ domain-containing protein [Sporolactobacillus nakayamae]|uniref:PilZ domain-containing protein n=1 Tax=Sporolactobacillus nakayamae TaxID=269670 RepID=A0A1I2UCJ3_9BACL|nr:PilZ domain-containing protein [Sporolactobacillus nakayamae]SFG73347.1 PilZ domain-containing protein [Sporolactobacillus nakayamae]
MSDNLVIILGAGIEGIFLLAILSAFILHYNKIINNDRKLITNLRQKVYKKNNSEEQSGERRRHHRIVLKNEKCSVKVLDFGEQTLQRLNNKSFMVDMLDISLGGMKIKCSIDFPVKKEVDVSLSFARVDGTMIHVKGMVVRKETKHGYSTTNYGIQFLNLSAKEETEIQLYINQKELSRKQFKSSADQ